MDGYVDLSLKENNDKLKLYDNGDGTFSLVVSSASLVGGETFGYIDLSLDGNNIRLKTLINEDGTQTLYVKHTN